ncbi:FkbM family methyltransferase [Aureibaculum sp. A20]|uniref:FkbM family methyltransferase n=1 Tax=Aureibaculum flavum TaxID=2795986 RepID=A0ABS0WQM9_9FLAO|nr:FkbM family methyltransferase [Aureibaculum flavum]MBJ2174280.1 FkbM family methyltransferase [Aureibaculum flavum]
MIKISSISTKVIRKINNVLGRGTNKFLKHVTGVIHIGANTGQERDLYRTHNLKVVWVEPIPKVYEKLKENIKSYENQKAIKALITNKNNKEYKFNIANNEGASSSILKLKEHKDIWPDVFYKETILLKSTTLEKLIENEKININNYQALVLDTQGSELLVLSGSTSILKHFKYIVVEVADFESYKDCCTLIQVTEFMKKQNFQENHRSKFVESINGGSYYDIVYKRMN